jgi:hypothetical protein
VNGKIKLKQTATHFAPAIFFTLCLLIAQRGKYFGLNASAADLFVLASATFATLLVLHQRLPLQNIVALTIILALFFGAAFLLNKLFQTPVSPTPLGFRNFLLWIIAFVNARGIAAFFLQRIRQRPNYGLCLIGLSSFLLTLLIPDARISLKFFLRGFCLALVPFIATVPWFIDKKRVEHSPNIQPLLIALLLFFWQSGSGDRFVPLD